MFRLEVDREIYLKKTMMYYRSLAGVRNKQDLITSMTRNGVLMNAHLCGWYFELSLNDVLNTLEKAHQEQRITPVFGSLDTISCFFLRSDIWELIPDFMAMIKSRKVPNTRLKIKDTLVDTCDIAFYYGVSRTVITKSILPKLRPSSIPTKNTRQTFYLWEEIIALEKSGFFQDVIMRSHQNYAAYTLDRSDVYRQARHSKKREAKHSDGYREEKIIFRDTECPRYDICRSFAVITDYMDCSLCVHNTQKKKTGASGIHDPAIVFINPKSKRHLSKLAGISDFPNAF